MDGGLPCNGGGVFAGGGGGFAIAGGVFADGGGGFGVAPVTHSPLLHTCSIERERSLLGANYHGIEIVAVPEKANVCSIHTCLSQETEN